MTKIAIMLGGALLLAGCQMSSEEDSLENSVRTSLAARGAVQQIEFTKTDANHMTGFAIVRDAGGADNRLTCSADRENGQGSNFRWRCVPAIDENLLTQTKAAIRQSLAPQGTVEQVELSRQDDDHITGYAMVRDAAGAENRFNCSAERDGERGDFSWHCTPPAGAGAPAGDDQGEAGANGT